MPEEAPTYFVKNMYGEVYRVNREQARKALESGWTLETPKEKIQREEEAEYGDRPIAAFLTGFPRAATFGFSDWLLKGAGVPQETLQGIERYNRGVSGTAEVGGLAASLFVPGGPLARMGTLARGAARLGPGLGKAPGIITPAVTRALGGTAGRGLAGKMLAKGGGLAAGVGVEAGLYGGGQLASDIALGNAELTAENILRYVGTMSILGGGLGAGLGASSVVLPAVFTKAKSSLQKMAPGEDQSLAAALWNRTAVPLAKRVSTKPPALVEEYLSMTPQAAKKRALGTLMGREQNEKIVDFFRTTEDFVKVVYDEKNLAYSGRKKLLKDLMKDVPIGEGVMATRRIIMDIDARLATFRAQPSTYGLKPDVSKIMEFRTILNRSIGKARKGKITTQELFEDVYNVRKNMGWHNKNVYGKGNLEQQEIAHQMRNVERNIRGIIDDSGIFGPAAKIYADMAEAFARFGEARTPFLKMFGKEKLDIQKFSSKLKKLDTPEGIKITQTLDEYINSSANLIDIFEQSVGSIQPLKKGLVEKLGADLLQKRKGMGEIMKARAEMRELLYGGGETVAETMGGVLGGLVGASMAGTLGMTSLGTWGAAGGLWGGFHVGKGMGRGLARLLTDPGKTAEMMVSLGKMNEKTDFLIKHSVRNFIKKTGKVSQIARPVGLSILTDVSMDGGKKPKTPLEGYKRTYERLAQVQADPTSLVELTQAPGLEELPQVQMALTAKTQNIANFLYDKIPKDPMISQVALPALREWKPGDLELKEFAAYLVYVNDPLLILKDLDDGNLTPESVEALRYAHPEIFLKIQQEIMSHLTDLRENLPYEKRLVLSQLLDVPIEESLLPENYQGLQNTFALEGQAEQELAQTMVKRITRAKELNLAEQEKTKLDQFSEVGNAR